MCVSCHQSSNLQDLDLRRQLAKICNAPLGTEEEVKIKFDTELKAVKSAAKALLKNSGKIPEARLSELRATLCNYYGVKNVDEELCKRGMKLESKIINEAYASHGKRVVDYFVS